MHALWRRDRLVLDDQRSLDWILAYPHSRVIARRFNTLAWQPANTFLSRIIAGDWLAGRTQWAPAMGWEVSTISVRWGTEDGPWDASHTTAGVETPSSV